MSAWIMLGSGCFLVAMGVLWIAMGGGFVLDGGPILLGLPSGIGSALSTVALGLILLAAVLQVRAGVFARRRADSND
ncbi:hypothetical protein C7M71_020640 [Peterkaempfera bronchialis]|uniref:Uncharacterized protein n=1 Tax=Peterkaempfera bronchialis TaxID=2126346 RepID=A0A345T0F3_9ACTN|nr:hypothetical protein C7M71_020640 [Peterkaempfera bronchialis]